jgi:hypothetical protein
MLLGVHSCKVPGHLMVLFESPVRLGRGYIVVISFVQRNIG